MISDEVTKQLEDAEASYLFTTTELLDKAKEAVRRSGRIKVRFVSVNYHELNFLNYQQYKVDILATTSFLCHIYLSQSYLCWKIYYLITIYKID